MQLDKSIIYGLQLDNQDEIECIYALYLSHTWKIKLLIYENLSFGELGYHIRWKVGDGTRYCVRIRLGNEVWNTIIIVPGVFLAALQAYPLQVQLL